MLDVEHVSWQVGRSLTDLNSRGVRTAALSTQPKRVRKVDRVPARIAVEIQPTRQPDRVRLREPTPLSTFAARELARAEVAEAALVVRESQADGVSWSASMMVSAYSPLFACRSRKLANSNTGNCHSDISNPSSERSRRGGMAMYGISVENFVLLRL